MLLNGHSQYLLEGALTEVFALKMNGLHLTGNKHKTLKQTCIIVFVIDKNLIFHLIVHYAHVIFLLMKSVP